jgi:hypothetical protein
MAKHKGIKEQLAKDGKTTKVRFIIYSFHEANPQQQVHTHVSFLLLRT